MAGAGTLDVEGSISAGTLQVTTFATFGGLGMWSFSGAAVFQAGSTFLVTLDGTDAGTQYTQLVSTNSSSGVNLGNSTLAASIGLDYEQTDQFTIISAPVIQNGFQNVVAGTDVPGRGPLCRQLPGDLGDARAASVGDINATDRLGQPQQSRCAGHLHAVVSTRTAPVTAGSVNFMQGSTVVATVSVNGRAASFTTASLPVGSTVITAVYSGVAGNLPSTSPTLVQTVVPYSTLTSLVSSGNPSLTGQTVTFTASVSTAACRPRPARSRSGVAVSFWEPFP